MEDIDWERTLKDETDPWILHKRLQTILECRVLAVSDVHECNHRISCQFRLRT